MVKIEAAETMSPTLYKGEGFGSSSLWTSHRVQGLLCLLRRMVF
jgi:hypothetical protein